ncbi:hypothetical protein GIW50_26355 [Pseudomonas syringae]|uniref:Uncharacterized protein n=1 Tax=Pseudomonas syringae TaxID=317 RepID=A0A9Q3X7V4_PSESX|nr:hypothetical protein [Pseudomonas syringae]MCF5065420.1 hypothetical protein [Pseudomonas syringae]MCF5075509.1 hypothetical protein [Pseudomonas syringae]MCF5121925.1 hypothetical protein [Pseudomonas syringae]MCF5380730.1 hypothetical protein [Pseudomonas syringae]
MKTKKIKAIIDNVEKYVTFKYDSTHIKLKFSEAENFAKTYTAEDMYLCLAKVRSDFPHIQFLCKGAKVNVRPSSMASQMSGGMVAYELTLGKRTTREDLVHIFDHEDQNLTNDPKEQEDFYKKWIKSIGAERTDPPDSSPHSI